MRKKGKGEREEEKGRSWNVYMHEVVGIIKILVDSIGFYTEQIFSFRTVLALAMLYSYI